MIRDEIVKELYSLKDEKYGEFQSKLIPTVDKETVIGVRTPELRKLAKEYARRDDVACFLDDLPHEYFEENQLHAFIISGIKEYEDCILRVNQFLPYVDNWATCDQMSPKVFKKNKDKLIDEISCWINSEDTYTIRFGVGMLMTHYLDEDFNPSYLSTVAGLRSDEYYINMMIAWYFATALAKQYDDAVKYIEERRLDDWTHNKAIQKAVESYRITDEQKAYLKTLKVKRNG